MQKDYKLRSCLDYFEPGELLIIGCQIVNIEEELDSKKKKKKLFKFFENFAEIPLALSISISILASSDEGKEIIRNNPEYFNELKTFLESILNKIKDNER